MTTSNAGVVNPAARSPYQKYAKKPRRYSPQLQALMSAQARGDEEDIRRAERSWRASLRAKERDRDEAR